MTPQAARERLIGELARTIQDSAAKPLSGYDLYVWILDVHMAGRPAFEAPGINSDLRIRSRTNSTKDFTPICSERSIRKDGHERRGVIDRSKLPKERVLPGYGRALFRKSIAPFLDLESTPEDQSIVTRQGDTVS
jgi:hypothetical protein